MTHNGILLMGGFALVLMIASRGSVDFLVVLYSINVFITFSLSQLGMVRHWWQERRAVAGWKKKIAVNGVGLDADHLHPGHPERGQVLRGRLDHAGGDGRCWSGRRS